MDKLRLALLRVGQFAQQVVERVGRLLGYPISLTLRLLVYVLAYLAPFFVLALLIYMPYFAGYVFKEFIAGDGRVLDIEDPLINSIIALGGLSVLFGMAVNRLVVWLTGLRDSLKQYFKSLPELPPLFVAFMFREEVTLSDQVFDRTFRWLFRVLRQSVGVFVAVASLGVLAAIVPLPPDPESDGTRKEIIILPSDPGCWGDDCASAECPICPPPVTEKPPVPTKPTVPEESTVSADPIGPEHPVSPGCPINPEALPELENNMQFLLLYPYYSSKKEVKKDEEEEQKKEDGASLTVSNGIWLDIIKDRASACSTQEKRVKLTVMGFASDQPMSPPKDPKEAERSNCGVANARGSAVAEYLNAKDATWKSVKKDKEEFKVKVKPCDEKCKESDAEKSGHQQNQNNNDSQSFTVDYQPWCDFDSMVAEREERWPETELLPDRQRFRHRSVLIEVEDAGICGNDG